MASFSAETPEIGDCPHQPIEFVFPKRKFGKTKVCERSFQATWFQQFPWVHYDETRDLAFCHTCIQAYNNKIKLISGGNMELTFVSSKEGFHNWKDGTRGLRAHGNSK